VKNIDLYQQATQKIIEAIESGSTLPWRKPWGYKQVRQGEKIVIVPTNIAPVTMPQNAKTKKCYRGINVLFLWLTAYSKGYSSNLWGTAKMWKELCGTPLSNQKPTEICFYFFIPRTNKAGKETRIPFLRFYQVYNLDQIYGCFSLRASLKPRIFNSLDFTPAEEVIKACKAKIIWGGNEAAYSPDLDCIRMPEKGFFETQIGYYTTQLHEHIHMSGHKKRLKRTFGIKGSETYAFEELVAELGACFLCSMLEIPEALHQMPQHASYIKDYLSLLKSDPRAIFKASSLASKAADFILKQKK